MFENFPKGFGKSFWIAGMERRLEFAGTLANFVFKRSSIGRASRD